MVEHKVLPVNFIFLKNIYLTESTSLYIFKGKAFASRKYLGSEHNLTLN